MEIENYSSSHKDWSGWAGLHPPSKADALCTIPPRASRLCVHQTGSRGGAEARRWGASGSGRLARHGRPDQGSMYLRTAIIRYPERAVGLMAIENLFRYPALAVGLKPSASQGEARPRGLWRNNYSKTISRLAMTGADHGGSCCRTGCRKRQPWGGICGFRISLL